MMTSYKTLSDSRDSFKETPMGKAKGVHVQLAGGDIVIVTTWRHTLAVFREINPRRNVKFGVTFNTQLQLSLCSPSSKPASIFKHY